MALKTKNAAGLVGTTAPGNKDGVEVEFLTGTYVASLEKDVNKGDKGVISAEDARFLIAYKMAKVCEPETKTDSK